MGSKLVRDKIPQIIEESGKTPQTHIADPEEYYTALQQKLKEEIEEYSVNDDVEELADILEVIRAIANAKQLNWNDLEKIRTDKAQKNGSFHKRIILDDIS